ncbi:MAG: hypothetical protein AAGJ83_09225 [Planctomycetota bacterium]
MTTYFDPTDDGFGTLLWVGDRDAAEFRDAYDFCEAVVAQLAFRPNMTDAIRRPASAVRTLMLCLEHDTPLHREAFNALCERYPESKPLLLTGPLCAGSRPTPSQLYGCDAIRWDAWESELPAYLRRCGWANQPRPRSSSIGIVASQAENAKALMVLASTGSIPVVWCRPDQLARVQNIEEYWWDDSATEGSSWEELLSRVSDARAAHVWVTGQLTPERRQNALDAGVEAVIAKPHEFPRLLKRLDSASRDPIRRAA